MSSDSGTGRRIEPLSEKDMERLQQQRDWVIGHFEDAGDYGSVAGKLRVIQTILDNGWIEKTETWKLQSLGVAFGDALVQEVPELFWVACDDECGRDPALRWLETTILAFPLTAISRRVEDDMHVDVFDLFAVFQKAVLEALANEA